MSDRIDIGQLNERVRFKMAIKGRQNDTGEEIKGFVSSNDVWAGIDYSSSSGEKEIASRKTDVTKVVFTMYFNEAVRQIWRIVHRNAEYEILSIAPDEKRMFMTVEAQNVEPWRDDYYTSKENGFYTDPLGNYWIAVNRGESQPTFGNLTWTDEDGNTWTTT